jgi:hypothetical protein
MLEHRVLDLVDARFELLDLRPVGVDHRVDQPVEERHRPFVHQLRVADDRIVQRLDGRRVPVVNGDQVVGAEKEIDVMGRDAGLAGVVVDAVQDHVEVAVVGLDLRVLQLGAGVLDRQRVEREAVAEDQELGNAGRGEIDPDERIGAGCQPRPFETLNPLGLTVPVKVDGEHGEAAAG